MSELVDFLEARLKEDAEEIAKHPDGEDDWEFMATGEMNYPCSPYLMIGKKRALAEVEAKQRILTEAEFTFTESEKRGEDFGIGLMETTLALLALPYSDHEDYRAEWAA